MIIITLYCNVAGIKFREKGNLSVTEIGKCDLNWNVLQEAIKVAHFCHDVTFFKLTGSLFLVN